MFQDEDLSLAGSGTRLKLEDKESIVGVFAGEPLLYWRHWNNATKRSAEFPKDTPQDELPEGSTLRFKTNFLVERGDRFLPLEFEGSVATTAKGIKKATDKQGQEYLYEISREGTGTKTRYHVLPEGPLSDDQKERVKSARLLPLKLWESKDETTTEKAS